VTTSGPLHGRIASFLSFIFFFSGFASLMYQIAWQRLLTLYYGVGTISITLIVSVYMFGLGVGALIGGALAERIHDKLRLYFVVQLLLAVFGFVSLPFLDFLGRLTAGSNYVISLWYMGSFLILPTTLMGMTLPLVTKIFMRFAKDLLSTVSYLYFLNSIGAACGALLGYPGRGNTSPSNCHTRVLWLRHRRGGRENPPPRRNHRSPFSRCHLSLPSGGPGA